MKDVHPRGIDFRYEADLVERLAPLLAARVRRPGALRVVVRRELGVGRVTADVVVAAWKGDPGTRRPLSARESVILASLRRSGPTRIDLLERRCGFPLGGLRGGQLAKLEREGLVLRGPGGRVALAADWFARPFIVAVEAKLLDWKRAIRQAVEYLRYADEAFIALPTEVAHRVAGHRQVFLDAGVGLLGVGEAVEEVIPAIRSMTHDWRREFAASRLLGGSGEWTN